MYVVLGATGNVGSNVVRALEKAGERIIAVTHHAAKAAEMASPNTEAAIVDVTDADALRAVFGRGRRAFILNPPADPGTDTNAAELRTVRNIADALQNSGLEKLVVQSTYGAREGDAIGDLSVLFELEKRAVATGIPTAINRAAYYFTNLDMLLDAARDGVLPTAFPETFELPMVSPLDVGRIAAKRLQSPVSDTGIQYVEGPETYTFADVAAAMSAKLGKPVAVQTIPREQWEESFRQVGFSPEAARSYARMTGATIDRPDTPSNPKRGEVTLREHISGL